MNLNSLRIFLLLAKSGNVSRTAELLDIAASSVSRKVKALEDELGAELFYRGGREFVLTATGQRIAEYAERLICDADKLKELANNNSEMKGIVRVMLPHNVAEQFSVNFIIPFMERYPEVEIKLTTRHGRQIDNMYEHDFALSPNLPLDTSLVAKPMLHGKRYFWAGKKFVSQYGEPKSLAGLINFPFISLANDKNLERGHQLVSCPDGKICRVPVSIKASVDSPRILAIMVNEGAGIGCFPIQAVRNLQQENLVKLFGDNTYVNGTIYGVFPPRVYLSHRVKVFIDELSEFIKLQEQE